MKAKTVLLLLLTLSAISIYGQEIAKVKESGKVNYIDTSGNYFLKTEFSKTGRFSNGRAAAQEDKKWGYIDTAGKWAIEPQYAKVRTFNSGLALVLKDDQWNYIDTGGKVLEVEAGAPDKFYVFKDGVAFYKKGEKIGLLGTDGKLVVEPIYDAVKKFHNGHAKVRLGELWGMVNTKGELVAPVEYTNLGRYSSKGLWAKKGEDLGVFNNGTFTVIPDITKIWDFNEDSNLTYAKKGDKIGFLSNDGSWVIEPSFDKVRAFKNGLAPVMNNKKWGYINEKGEQVIDFQFKDAEVFSADGLAPVKEKKWGFIDTTGKVIIPMEYDIESGFSFLNPFVNVGFYNGLARVKSKKGWGFLNKKGELLGDKWYKNAEYFEKAD